MINMSLKGLKIVPRKKNVRREKMIVVSFPFPTFFKGFTRFFKGSSSTSACSMKGYN